MFYPGVLTEEEARDRFDHMVAVCQAVPFGKQPVTEVSSGVVVGYTGVDYIAFEGRTWLEWGYRLVPECRGLGYATEASQALLAKPACADFWPMTSRRRAIPTFGSGAPGVTRCRYRTRRQLNCLYVVVAADHFGTPCQTHLGPVRNRSRLLRCV